MPPGTIYVPVSGTGTAPQTYTVPGAATIGLDAVRADFDGSGAAAFLPAVQILDSSGNIMASVVGDEVAAGGSASVTFAPFLRGRQTAATATTGAWAIVYRSHAQGDAYLSVPSGGFVAVPFRHLETSDQTVFSTKPNNTAGDTRLAVFAPGVYTFEMGAGWRNTFAQQAGLFISVQTFHGPSWSHPADMHVNQAGAGALLQNYYWDSRVYPFTAADLGGSWAEIIIQVFQVTGVAQDLDQMWLRVAYTPTADTEVVVY